MVTIKQELRQSQQLVMTQQLQQSIKLLQLSTAELQEYIDGELEKNPLLTREDTDGHDEASATNDAGNQEVDTMAPTSETQDAFQVAESTTYSESTTDDRAFEEPSYSAGAADASGGSFNYDEGRSLEETLSSDKDLRSHLNEQIAVDITDPVEKLIAISLVDQLDDSGYLREDISKISEQLGVTEEAVSKAIMQCQKLEPTGVFARDLEDCLRLQLKEMDRLDPVMEILLDNLDMLGRGDREKLRKLCNADAEDFEQMLEDVRRCNPKPTSGFARDDVHAVIPDVLVRRGKESSWLIELNSEALPKVLFNQRYATKVGDKADKEAKKYMNEQMANANWLVKALDQRANTILKVAEAIVKQQDMFLMHGIRFLKPLVLKDIAAAVEMHESTISRVTTNKFMATPRGTLEMKFFFTSSIQGASGNTDFSSKTVQYYIKELIDNETIEKVLSDDAIVKALHGRNIDVARRTVTKYREAMNIPSSVVRRRILKGQAIS